MLKDVVLCAVESSVSHGVTTLYTPGLYGMRGRVASYAPRGVNKALSAVFLRDLTVFSSFSTFCVHFLWLLLSLVIMVSVGQRWAYPDTQSGQPSCPDTATNRHACGLESVLNKARLEFRFLIAFLLSGYVAYTVSMWAKRRSNYASLCGCTRNLLLQISSMLPVAQATGLAADCHDSMGADESSRATLCRWVLLTFELAVLKPRGAMDTDEGRSFVLSERLASPAEWESMVPGDRHTTVLFWVQHGLKRLADDGVLTQHALTTCCASAISDMRAQANDLMSSLDRDPPLPYHTLAGLLVEINVLLMTVCS